MCHQIIGEIINAEPKMRSNIIYAIKNVSFDTKDDIILSCMEKLPSNFTCIDLYNRLPKDTRKNMIYECLDSSTKFYIKGMRK